MNEYRFRKLISGQTKGPAAALLRLLLAIISLLYASVIRFRNFMYCKGWLKTNHMEKPVISIGNITTGGTGKTPLVIWLCNLLAEKNISCAILTRGYKTTKDSVLKVRKCEDEPALLAENCPDARVVINSNRLEGAVDAVNLFGAKALVLDDGFQHRRLGRDLDIVTIDATEPFGYDKVLPAGLLREPLSALKRTDAVVVTRCDQITMEQLAQLEEKLQQINPDVVIATSMHTPVCAKSAEDNEISLDELKNKNVFAFCGIGNPKAFLNTIKKLGGNIVGSRLFNDHHYYKEACLKTICEQAQQTGADLILTTQKDWTKITLSESIKKDIPFAYLEIKLKFVRGEEKIRELIEKVLADKMSEKTSGN